MAVGFPPIRLFLQFCLLTGFLTLPAHAEEEVSFLRSIHIEKGAVSSDAVCFGCSVIVDGHLDGDAVAFAGDIVAKGVVEGNAVTIGGGIQAPSGARLGGDVVAVGGPADVSSGVTEGEVVSVPYFFFPGQRSLHLIGTLVFVGVNLFLLLLSGLLLRSRLERMAAPLTRRPLLTLAASLGVLTLFGLLEDTVSNLSFQEVLDSVLAMILCPLLLAGYSAISSRLGALIAPGKSQWVILLAGAAVTTLLLIIPVAGLFAAVVFSILSIGCAFISGLGSDPDWFVTQIIRRKSSPARS